MAVLPTNALNNFLFFIKNVQLIAANIANILKRQLNMAHFINKNLIVCIIVNMQPNLILQDFMDT